MRPERSRVVVLGVCLLALLSGIVLQLIPRRHVLISRGFSSIAEASAGIEGVVVTELPLAESTEIQARMEELLSFDQAFLRNYTGPGGAVQVYVAYWKPGKQKPRYIADHTPDICWPLQGWEVLVADERKIVKIEGRQLQHCQMRSFQRMPVRVNVWYWHLYGGRNSGYAEGRSSKGNNWLRSFREETIDPLYEQYFVRISSTDDLDSLLAQHWFVELLKALGPTGVDVASI